MAIIIDVTLSSVRCNAMWSGSNLPKSWGHLPPSLYYVQEGREQTPLKHWHISNKLAAHPKDSILDHSPLLSTKVKNLQSLMVIEQST
jgi:carbonic anhydrase